MNLIFGKRFETDLRKLLRKSPDYEEKVKKCLRLLMRDTRHPSLRWHKLKGKEVFSVSVDMKMRIILHVDGEQLYLLRLGNHSEVY